MIFSRFPFLFVLFLLAITCSQVLPSSSFCLGNCTTCDPLSLTKCLLPHPCDWNFYNEKGENQCLQAPSTELVLQELGQTSTKTFPTLSKGWSQSKKQSHCEYTSSQGKKYIQILGLYSGVEVLQKIFEVDPLSDTYELTFDLVHSPWLPFNDFLIIDLMSQNENIVSLQISFDSRISVDSQAAVITCNGVRIMTKKYSIKFANYNRVNNQLTAVFTSFLFNSVWGITNVRMQQGCLGYAIFNAKTQKCSLCDSDSFAVSRLSADWCQKCPSLCRSCQSKTKCLRCVEGAQLNKFGLCEFGDMFKTQVALLSQNLQTCDGQLTMGSSFSKISLPMLKNEQELLYDQIQLGFNLYYLPNSWKPTTKNYISVKLNKIEVMRLDYRNMTNQGVIRCLAFKEKRAAKIQIFSGKIVHNDNTAVIEFELVGSQDYIQFGIGAVRVKSLIKKKAAVEVIAVPVIETKPISNPSATSNSSLKNQDIEAQLPKMVEILNNNTTMIVPQQSITIPQKEIETINNPQITVAPPVVTEPQSKTTTNQTQNNSSTAPSLPIQKIQVSKYLQNLLQNAETNTNISFITSTNDDHSGIEIHIKGQFINSSNITYNSYIDKLDQSDYKVKSYKVEDGKLRLFIKIDHSFTDANVAIYSLANTSRLLVDGAPQLVGTFKIDRFDAMTQNQISTLNSFSNLFSLTAWLALILIFLAVLLGNGVTVQQFVNSLQVIFLHAYIASEYLPLTFRDVIGALDITKNLNFFATSHRKTIQNGWIGEPTHTGPARFYLFDSSIHFLREFYPIIFVNLLYLIWFCCIHYAQKRLNKDLIDQQKQIHHRTLDNIVNRVINFCDQIWRYQFMSTMWICFVQFYDLASPRSGAVFNGFLCITAFMCSIAWPVIVTLYCRRQYYECEYSQYLYFYEDIYYGKIPQYELPSPHHRVGYPTVKTAKLFLIALVICYFGSNPIFALFTLITLQVAEILYTKKYEIYIDRRYWILRVIQNTLFVVIDFVLLVMLLCGKIASSNVFKSMGYFLSGLALLVLINSTVRMCYLGHRKYKQLSINEYYQNYQIKKPQTQRVV